MTLDAREVRRLSTSETHCLATWRNVLIAVWRKVPGSERLREVQGALTQLAQRTGPICVVVVVEQGAGVPDGPTRSAAAELMRSAGDKVVGWTVVIEGGGILRPTIRSVAVAAKLIARTSFPLQISATADAAASWLRGLPGAEDCAEGELDQLSAAVATVRAAFTCAA